jgi:hypothetical protein
VLMRACNGCVEMLASWVYVRVNEFVLHDRSLHAWMEYVLL